MRRPVLITVLAAVTVLAVTPALLWLLALLPAVDDGLRDAIRLLAVTIPVGLGAAAVVVAIHGLQLTARYQEEADAELEDIRSLQLVGAAPAAPIDGTIPRASKTARTAPAPRSKGERARRRATAMARRELRRKLRF